MGDEQPSGRRRDCYAFVANPVTCLFYVILMICLSLAVLVSVRTLFLTTADVTKYTMIETDVHEAPAILFFGEGYQLDICSNFEMQAGSTDFIEMLRDGRTCKRASIHINVTDEEIEAWDHQEVSHTTDFATSIDKVFKNWKSKINQSDSTTEKLNLSLIAVRGPTNWTTQDSIYLKMISPKQQNLHAFYLLGSFDHIKTEFEHIKQIASENSSLGALLEFQHLIASEKAVFRYLPTQSLSLLNMFKNEISEDGILLNTRITVEQTVSFSLYDKDDFDCQSGKDAKRDFDDTDNDDDDPIDVMFEEAGQFTWPVDDNPGNWAIWDEEDSFEDQYTRLCSDISVAETYSESVFRWYDGIIQVKNTYDSTDPWTIFGTLTTLILGLDRLYTTLKRYNFFRARKTRPSPRNNETVRSFSSVVSYTNEKSLFSDFKGPRGRAQSLDGS